MRIKISLIAALLLASSLAGCVSSNQNTPEGAAVNNTQHNAGTEPATIAATTTVPEHSTPAVGNDTLPPNLEWARHSVGGSFNERAPYYNFDFFHQVKSFEEGAKSNGAEYGQILSTKGKYVFEFQGVDHTGDRDIAHFDVYFLHSTKAGDFVEKKHIDLENYPFPLPTNELEAKTQLAQYMQIINSKKDTTSGPIAVLNFHGTDQYDFKLVAKVIGMEDGYPNADKPYATDKAVLQAVEYSVAKK